MCPVRGRGYGRGTMSTTLSPTGVEVRDAGGSDLPAVRRVLLAAYQEYATALPPAVFGRYLAEILDVEDRFGSGRLLVAEHGGRVVGTVTYYDDAATEGLGWPAGWAGLRALGVAPSARGLGVGRALVDACRRRALAAGAPALTLHTGGFMTAAVALYERMGFRRDPAYDFDATSRLRLGGVRPVPILAYRLDLTRHHDREQPMGGPAAIVGELYENPATGERGVVRVTPTEANGHLLVVDLYLRPGGRVAGEHVHPVTTEAFTVVRGQLAVRHDGRDHRAGPGTRFQVAPGVAHDFWNASGEEVRVLVEVQPGERLVQLIRQLFLTAQDGRTDAKGRPKPLQAALLAREFADTMRFTSPPRLVQRALSGLLAPVARATGHRALDPAYLRRELPIVDLEPLPAEIGALVPGLANQPTRSTP
jgi:GNAT superfamily N-acetyltransferase/quercetin dioxygenase-like cupin family protein